MTVYRCYRLDLDGRISGVEHVEADTDEWAIVQAELVFENGGKKAAYEIWDESRMVHQQLA